ncbi:serine decarboxylase-like, partial [Raphidocelis subcapitata]
MATASPAVALASSCPLPHVVADSSERHVSQDTMRVLRSERLKGAGPALQVAPYQATPVCGAITHHHAAGLHIPDEERPVEDRIAAINETIQKYEKKLQERTRHHMGYPYNLDFDFDALEGLTRYSINNLGDPFIESNYGVHSREFE